MSGEVFVLFFIGFAFATFWLSLYTYALFSLGRRLAIRYRMRVGPILATFAFCLMAAAVDLPFLAVGLEPIYKMTLLFGVWLLHAQPTSVGYWSTCEIQRKRDEERWASRTQVWVAEFEEPIAECMKDFEEKPGA